MFKVLRAEKDAYITDRVISGERSHSSNTGEAASIDLFKLYGITSSSSSPNVELSRAFIKFDLDPIRELITTKKLDIANPTFTCRLKLFDVDGGQTVPSNYTLTVHPMSRSFDEGLGRNVVLYDDHDVCNFLTGSRSQGPWVLSGANSGGHNSANVDYLVTATLNAGVSSSLEVTQTFTKGTEDMNVDVTRIVSATLANIIPDEGFRIAFTASLEGDTRTYFVKRFASRHAYDETFHPRLEFTFDDSVQDDTSNLVVGSSGSMFLYNFSRGAPASLLSASVAVTGNNCVALRLQTAVSGGFLTFVFTGSQHTVGSNQTLPVTGVYSASVIIPETAAILNKLNVSGSILFTPIWGSLDGTVAYLTGSKIRVSGPSRGSSTSTNDYSVTVNNVKPSYDTTESSIMRVSVFDPSSPKLVATRIPVNFSGLIIRDVHYQIRSDEDDKIVIPFDVTYNSTRVSSDADGMFFTLDASNLLANRTYVIDLMLNTNGMMRVFKNASPAFRVVSVT